MNKGFSILSINRNRHLVVDAEGNIVRDETFDNSTVTSVAIQQYIDAKPTKIFTNVKYTDPEIKCVARSLGIWDDGEECFIIK